MVPTPRLPDDGLKVSLVEDTFAAEIEPDVALVNVKNLDAFVDVSSVIVVPEVTAVVVTPVINPFAFTVMVGIAPPDPKVPTLLFTVANVVALLTDVISPVKFGILVVEVAVPVNAPTNVVAVTELGKLVLPEPSRSVAVLVREENTPVYCLTCIGSVPSSAVAISTKPELVAVAPTKILNWSLSPMLPRTSSVEVVPVTVPVSVPINVVAVTTPVTLIPDELIVTPEPTTILVAVALPNTGVTNVGLVANTTEPLPVSSVNAVAN